ncbi:unnamed protein product [Owenia fusiformis]|uniref:Uncharacterized protein n=1 Tax=Owenia fusiformis TaxID=6347 RepID=A0A8J1XS45_OWEFU|nr:unnamed protein product [Owenia fusiformis]
MSEFLETQNLLVNYQNKILQSDRHASLENTPTVKHPMYKDSQLRSSSKRGEAPRSPSTNSKRGVPTRSPITRIVPTPLRRKNKIRKMSDGKYLPEDPLYQQYRNHALGLSDSKPHLSTDPNVAQQQVRDALTKPTNGIIRAHPGMLDDMNVFGASGDSDYQDEDLKIFRDEAYLKEKEMTRKVLEDVNNSYDEFMSNNDDIASEQDYSAMPKPEYEPPVIPQPTNANTTRPLSAYYDRTSNGRPQYVGLASPEGFTRESVVRTSPTRSPPKPYTALLDEIIAEEKHCTTLSKSQANSQRISSSGISNSGYSMGSLHQPILSSTQKSAGNLELSSGEFRPLPTDTSSSQGVSLQSRTVGGEYRSLVPDSSGQSSLQSQLSQLSSDPYMKQPLNYNYTAEIDPAETSSPVSMNYHDHLEQEALKDSLEMLSPTQRKKHQLMIQKEVLLQEQKRLRKTLMQQEAELKAKQQMLHKQQDKQRSRLNFFEEKGHFPEDCVSETSTQDTIERRDTKEIHVDTGREIYTSKDKLDSIRHNARRVEFNMDEHQSSRTRNPMHHLDQYPVDIYHENNVLESKPESHPQVPSSEQVLLHSMDNRLKQNGFDNDIEDDDPAIHHGIEHHTSATKPQSVHDLEHESMKNIYNSALKNLRDSEKKRQMLIEYEMKLQKAHPPSPPIQPLRNRQVHRSPLNYNQENPNMGNGIQNGYHNVDNSAAIYNGDIHTVPPSDENVNQRTGARRQLQLREEDKLTESMENIHFLSQHGIDVSSLTKSIEKSRRNTATSPISTLPVPDMRQSPGERSVGTSPPPQLIAPPQPSTLNNGHMSPAIYLTPPGSGCSTPTKQGNLPLYLNRQKTTPTRYTPSHDRPSSIMGLVDELESHNSSNGSIHSLQRSQTNLLGGAIIVASPNTSHRYDNLSLIDAEDPLVEAEESKILEEVFFLK